MGWISSEPSFGSRGPSLKETVGRIMQSSAYQRAPDGDPAHPEVEGTKQAILTGTVSKYREAAHRMLRADPNVRAAMAKRVAEGRAAFTAQRAPKSDQQTGAEALRRVGEAFGVDLGGVMPGQ